jgi:hypothetical protein
VGRLKVNLGAMGGCSEERDVQSWNTCLAPGGGWWAPHHWRCAQRTGECSEERPPRRQTSREKAWDTEWSGRSPGCTVAQGSDLHRLTYPHWASVSSSGKSSKMMVPVSQGCHGNDRTQRAQSTKQSPYCETWEAGLGCNTTDNLRSNRAVVLKTWDSEIQ